MGVGRYNKLLFFTFFTRIIILSYLWLDAGNKINKFSKIQVCFAETFKKCCTTATILFSKDRISTEVVGCQCFFRSILLVKLKKFKKLIGVSYLPCELSSF